MIRAAGAGVAYFVAIMAAALILGSVRIVATDAQMGAIATRLIELSLILGAAWLSCGWIVKRLAVPTRAADRLVMGGMAFLLLIVAALLVTLFIVGGSVSQHFSAYGRGGPAIVLAGQVLIAIFPLLRLRREKAIAAATGAPVSGSPFQAAIGE